MKRRFLITIDADTAKHCTAKWLREAIEDGLCLVEGETVTIESGTKIDAKYRNLKHYLQELSAAVSLTVHHIDKRFRRDKDIPYKASGDLARISNGLDLQNDIARRYALNLSITAEGKKKFVEKLLKK